MQYYWRVFLWENGGKKAEYTDYLTIPIFLEDRLDETLDSGEIVLEKMPITTRDAFPPKTKFRIERYVTAECTDTPRKWDLIVEHDDVEAYAGMPEACCHRVNLIEASAIAQGMHVDNIALTYELQDVSLNYKTVGSNTDTLGDVNGVAVAGNGYPSPVQANPPMALGVVWFRNSYLYEWREHDTLRSILYEQDARTAHTIEFTIPTLMARCAEAGTWQDLCECQTKTQVIKRHFRKSTMLSETVILEKNCGPTSLPANTINNIYNIGGEPSIHDPSKPLPPSPKVVYATGIIGFGSRTDGLFISYNDLEQFSQHYRTSTTEISRENPNAESKEVSFNTDVLSEEQLANGERYTYEIKCTALKSSLPIHYECHCEVWKTTGPAAYNNSTSGRNNSLGDGNGTWQKVQGSTITVSATTCVTDLSTDAVGSNFLVQPRKYNCYDLLRKALLTCDTQVFDNSQKGLDDIEYPIMVDDRWASRLRGQTMFETVFEQKNLWEVLLQIGQYLHAIPLLEYAEDGTDRFVLRFNQLGNTTRKENTSTKITVFNSKNLSDYFTQYDSYVTNLFSPQNLVDEWVVPKTSDSSYLVSNNTAEVHTKYPIQEVVDFEIEYNGVVKGALDYIFEQSIYRILNPNTKIKPSKATALYYALGKNIIEGLNYAPPSVNNDAPYALKSILAALFGVDPKGKIRFNDIRFHVVYRTQDTLRISMVRPDIHLFAKNSSLEKYPHHDQYFGQQDKIVDSERFSANLWGRLVRVANNVYQCQEYSDIGNEKESGDLVTVDGDTYYIMSTENEYYGDAIFQKVTYSKNFNQISNIVTIPSEPRFYEVSERSQVRREVMLMDFLTLSETKPSSSMPLRFLSAARWKAFIKYVLFKDGADPGFPNFAYTRFKGDKKRQHRGSYGQVLPLGELFPSVEVDINPGTNAVVPKQSSDHRDVIVPLLHFPLKNAITFVWDMDDNFKAGDSIDTTTHGKDDLDDEAYFSLQSVRYCDIMGRADLFSFKLFNKTNWTMAQTRRLPFAEGVDFTPTDAQSLALVPNDLSVGLDKDNREALSFNYQINLLQESTAFVTFSNLFGEKKGRLKMCLLNREVSMFDEVVNISGATVVADNIDFNLIDNSLNAIELRITGTTAADLSDVKSIVLYDEEEASKYACIAKNVGGLTNENKMNSWWIFPVFN